MNVSTDDDLLQMVAPFIERGDTVVRNSIPASQRLCATLRFVATRQAFEDCTGRKVPCSWCARHDDRTTTEEMLHNFHTRRRKKNWHKSVCTIYFKPSHCFFNHCENPTPSTVTAQTRYCAINTNTARVGAPLHVPHHCTSFVLPSLKWKWSDWTLNVTTGLQLCNLHVWGLYFIKPYSWSQQKTLPNIANVKKFLISGKYFSLNGASETRTGAQKRTSPSGEQLISLLPLVPATSVYLSKYLNIPNYFQFQY
jgi:hypothetical protein